ncbi:MAG: ADP-glyceromanno-heptose 6-epimerase [Bdellovibrionales bacterium GWA2_49_15]|nr:MAG: ADP-glyceromanno-heptose 6-epimerase [Bdellovibrionales bacterium GWA2_49_15]HAZ14280.1 ADP-glyceromanno-heptose 6-epimerase [Bdellovibrionales bacterium]
MILVTGGAGFIGSVLARDLNRRGHKDLIIVDRLGKADKWKNLRHVNFEDFIHADELFLADRDDLFSQLTAIYHLGACSSTTENDVDFLMGNNYAFSKNIFNLATQYDIPLVYASSAATYGDGEQGYADNESKAHALLPLNPYGFSKKIFDDWVLGQKSTPARWFGVKFFNVYGPNEYHKGEMRSIVHKAFGQIQTSGKVKLFKSHKAGYKDGEQLRDFVYVNDVTAGMISLIEDTKKKASGIYNMGTGKARSFLDLVTAVFRALDKTPEIEFIDMPLNIRDQYQYFTEADMGKIKKILPKLKLHTLEEGVKDYVQNYLIKADSYFQ